MQLAPSAAPAARRILPESRASAPPIPGSAASARPLSASVLSSSGPGRRPCRPPREGISIRADDTPSRLAEQWTAFYRARRRPIVTFALMLCAGREADAEDLIQDVLVNLVRLGPVPDSAVPAGGATVEIRSDGAVTMREGTRTELQDDRTVVVLLRAGDTIRAGERTLTIGRSVQGEGPEEAVHVLSRPSLLVNHAQEARIQVGREVPYLQPVTRGDETLYRRITEPGLREGLTLEVSADLSTPGRVLINPLRVRLDRIEGRDPVEGLELDAGRPRIDTETFQAAADLAPGEAALVWLRTPSNWQQPIFILVTAEQRRAPQ